jgi:serine/threonine protein kinase
MSKKDLSVSKGLQKMSMNEDETKWELEPDSIKLGKRLGSGAFGEVYKGKLYGKEVAVKKLLNQNLDGDSLSSFKKEVTIMSKLRHPNVLLFMGACTEPGNLMIVTELMTSGSVYDLLHDKSVSLTFKRRMKIAKGAALGMNYLHCTKPPFIHRDLKTSNLLVDENFNVKVCDFGLSHAKASSGKGVRGSYGSCGTPLWMAPEVLLNKPYDESADVYSFGIVLWELLTQDDPFPEIDTLNMMLDQVVNGNHRPTMPDTCPTRLKQLIEACWQGDPGKRPPFEKVIPLFNQIIVDSIVKDKHGRAMWKKQFMNKDTLLEQVPWSKFVFGFTAYFKQKVPSNPDDVRFLSLHALVTNAKNEEVSIESFGRFLEWFGPIDSLDGVLDRVVNLLKKSWFHGEISADDAERLLKQEKKGTFLVRFSARDPGSYAITTVSDTNKIKHFRVYHKPGLKYLIGKTECDTLEDIIGKYHKDLYLKIACPGSPFEEIFRPQSQKVAKNVGCGYLVPEFD